MKDKFAKIYETTIIVEPSEQKIFDDVLKLSQYIISAAKAGKMTPKNLTVDFLHGKQHTGYSIILVVSESHLALYTYPEFNRIHINVATCSDAESVQNIVNYFKKVFKIKNQSEIKIINITE